MTTMNYPPPISDEPMEPTRVDVIFLSLSDSEENRQMTSWAIETLLASEIYPQEKREPGNMSDGFHMPVEFRVIVVESFRSFLVDGHRYLGTTVIIPREEFNFHGHLKHGIRYTGEFKPAPWTVLANNDLVFHQGWMSNILQHHEITGIRSFGTWCERSHGSRFLGQAKSLMEGYRIGYEYTGWCQVFKRDLLDTLDLKEDVMFWYSDNILADQLRRRKERHALLRESKVDHLESATINKFDRNKLHQFTHAQTIIYQKNRKS